MADIELPKLKSDAAKELAPYLLTILRTQAVLLEKLGYQLPHQEDAEQLPDKSDIYDDLLRKVLLEAAPKKKASSSRQSPPTIIVGKRESRNSY